MMKKLKRMVCVMLIVCLSVGIMPTAAATKSSEEQLTNTDVVKLIAADMKKYVKTQKGTFYSRWCAHRGCSDYAPENTYCAFKLALKLNAHSVETDVRMTSDGVLACVHDASIWRITGVKKRVAKITWKELKSYPITLELPYKHLKYNPMYIITLEKCLSLVSKDKDAYIRIEFKNPQSTQDLDEIAQKIYDLVFKYKMQKRSVIISNYYDAIDAFAKIDKLNYKKNKVYIPAKLYGDVDGKNTKLLQEKWGTKIVSGTYVFPAKLGNGPLIVKNKKRYALKMNDSRMKLKLEKLK